MSKKKDVLGEGSYAQVHKYVTDDGEEVALKRYTSEKNSGLGISYRELEMLCHLSHPNITAYKGLVNKVLDFPIRQLKGSKEMEDGRLHLLMEKGLKDLYRHQRGARGARRQLTHQQIKVVVRDVLLALEYLHYNGIIHRDLSVTNVLMMTEDESRYALCDFGMSKYYTHDTERGGLYVNEAYRAPELFSGSSYDYGVDVWAAGAIMQEMLLNKNPYFDGVTPARALLVQHIPVCPRREGLETWIEKHSPRLSAAMTQRLRRLHDERASGSRLPLCSTLEQSEDAEQLFELLSGMLSFYPRRRMTAKQALDSPWFDEHRRHIEATRQRYLKKAVIHEDTLTFPDRQTRESISELIKTLPESLFIEGIDTPRRIIAQLCMSFDLYYRALCSQDPVILSDIASGYHSALYVVCLGMAIKYYRTNCRNLKYEELVPVEMREYLTPEYFWQREMAVLESLGNKLYYTTAFTVAVEMGYSVNDEGDGRKLIDYYLLGRAGLHDVRQDMTKLLSY